MKFRGLQFWLTVGLLGGGLSVMIFCTIGYLQRQDLEERLERQIDQMEGELVRISNPDPSERIDLAKQMEEYRRTEYRIKLHRDQLYNTRAERITLAIFHILGLILGVAGVFVGRGWWRSQLE